MAANNVEMSVGTTVSISAAQPATEDQVGYEALSWTLVGEVTAIGTAGGTATINEFTPVASGIVHKRKGSINYGTQSLTIAKDASDAGQVILKAGFDGAERDTIHSVKIVESVSGEVSYFMGLISSFETDRGDSNTIISHNVNVERTSATTVV